MPVHHACAAIALAGIAYMAASPLIAPPVYRPVATNSDYTLTPTHGSGGGFAGFGENRPFASGAAFQEHPFIQGSRFRGRRAAFRHGRRISVREGSGPRRNDCIWPYNRAPCLLRMR
jgi:hypothetical protein